MPACAVRTALNCLQGIRGSERWKSSISRSAVEEPGHGRDEGVSGIPGQRHYLEALAPLKIDDDSVATLLDDYLAHYLLPEAARQAQ